MMFQAWKSPSQKCFLPSLSCLRMLSSIERPGLMNLAITRLLRLLDTFPKAVEGNEAAVWTSQGGNDCASPHVVGTRSVQGSAHCATNQQKRDWGRIAEIAMVMLPCAIRYKELQIVCFLGFSNFPATPMFYHLLIGSSSLKNSK